MQMNDNECGRNFVIMCIDGRMIINGDRSTVVSEGTNNDTEVVEVFIAVEMLMLVNRVVTIVHVVEVILVVEVFILVEIYLL